MSNYRTTGRNAQTGGMAPMTSEERFEANNDEVICPSCCHQFRAIPVNIQARIKELEAELAALKGKQEPVACWEDVVTRARMNYASKHGRQLEDSTLLYLSPPNEKQIMAKALREAAAIWVTAYG